MPFVRKPVKAGIIASYCLICENLVAGTKAKPKKNLKLLDLMEKLHRCRGDARDLSASKDRREK
jgi:hypothetical protein